MVSLQFVGNCQDEHTWIPPQTDGLVEKLNSTLSNMVAEC